MDNKEYTFNIDLNWQLIGLISQIDRFDASWTSIERKEEQSLKQLKSIATVRSVGASTRIEGSRMSNREVEVLLKEINISKLEDRDSQEVVGYFQTLDLLSESYMEIDISESSLKSLHNIVLKYSQKDGWHKGDYKQHSNAVEAQYPDGTKQVIFQTTEAGYPTQDAMRELIDWYKTDNETHPLVKCALFAYQFEAIHPLQDGNGRTGRILNLLYLFSKGLLSQPVLYMSKFIIVNKEDYYYKLGAVTQRNSWEPWIEFMLEATEKTSILTDNMINEILKQMDSTLEYAKAKIKWYNKEVNEAIFSQPYIKPSVIGKIIGKSSRTTLTKYINELVSYKILRSKKDGVEVFYINDDLLRILER